MTDSRWQEIEALFLATADLAPAARETYLLDACPEDVDLRHEVNSLLGAEPWADDALGSTVADAARDFADHLVTSRVGDRVGAYRLVDILGQGGMGTVYLAERADDAYRARVAIKFVRGSYAAPELERRFLAERQILADLNHTGIARLLDGGTTIDGTPYLVLEFVEGMPIDEWCDDRGLDVRARVELLLKVCEAVQYAHDANVVHRDLKPSNILVTAAGAPKLVDFGIAKLLSDPGRQQTATALQVLTPAYASPEQLKGEPVTPASDVYSLGVVMYRLLAGRLPFDLSNASAGEVERRVCREVPPLLSRVTRDRDSAWRQALSGEVEGVVARALAKRGQDRYPSVSALAVDLRAWLAVAPGRRRLRAAMHFAQRHRLRLVAAAVLGIVATTTALSALEMGREAPIAFRMLATQVIDPGVRAPFRVVTADVNGDGRSDLVWNHLDDSTNQVAVGLGQRDGTFVMQPVSAHPSTPPEGWRRSVRMLVADVNGDGRDDLVWSRVGEALFNLAFIAFSNADGSFRFAEPFHFGHATLRWASSWQPLVADIDADGRDDLVFNILNDGNTIRAFRSQGDGSFHEMVPIVHPAKAWQGYQAFTGDVDGDRREDLVWNDVPVWANRLYVARSWGDRVDLLSHQDHPVSEGWSQFAANMVDVDSDGRSDVVWSRTRGDTLDIFAALGQPNAQFRYLPISHLRLPQGVRLTSAVIADFNGDRRIDLGWRVKGRPNVVVLRASRSGRLNLTGTSGMLSPDDRVLIDSLDLLPMDVNADGRDDLVWVDPSSARVYVAVAAPR